MLTKTRLKLAQHCSGVILLLLLQYFYTTEAVNSCHQCSGINCQRTNYANVEKCENAMDSCITVFEGTEVLVQGCLSQVPSVLRAKCNVNGKCDQCNTELCNNKGPADLKCLQCDSKTNADCHSNPQVLSATSCGIPRGVNSYCFVEYDAENTQRGCALNLTEQQNCLKNTNCMLCSAADVSGCNNVKMVDIGGGGSDGDGSGSGGNDGSGSGGNDGSGSGGNDGSGSGGSGGSGTGGDGSGSGGSGGSGTGGDGSGSGGSASGGSGNGTDSHVGNSAKGITLSITVLLVCLSLRQI